MSVPYYKIWDGKLTFIAPEDVDECFFCSPKSVPSCKIPSRLSSSSIVLDTTLEEGSKWFNLFEELVEELEGRSVDELLICVREDEIPADFPSLLVEFDSDNFVPKSKWPVIIGCVEAVVASDEVDMLGKYGDGLCNPTAAAACAAAAAAACVCNNAADACKEFCGDKNGDVLALLINCACSCCKCAEWTKAGLIAPSINRRYKTHQ